MKLIFFCLLISMTGACLAESKFHVSFDEEGRPTYSTIPRYGDATEADDDDADEPPAPMPERRRRSAPKAGVAVTQPDFPHITKETQSVRDNDRYQILAIELNDEMAALAFAQGKNDVPAVKTREANVAALRRELSNVKK